MEYDYEPEMEETYRSGMLKAFKKTLDDGFFPFIILDSIHDRVRHFEQFWSAAKTKGFEVQWTNQLLITITTYILISLYLMILQHLSYICAWKAAWAHWWILSPFFFLII